MNKKYGIIALVILGLVCLLFFVDHFTWCCVNLDAIKARSISFKQYVDVHYAVSAIIYVAAYTLIIALGIPGVAPLSILAGFLFGFMPGLLYAVIGSTFGSVVSFLAMRYWLRRTLHQRYAKQLSWFKKQMDHYGVSYLLMIHFSSVVPYFVINTLAALADISIMTLIWTTVVGSLPLLSIYVLAGKELATLRSIGDIFSPTIIILLITLISLAFIPIIIKRIKHIRIEF